MSDSPENPKPFHLHSGETVGFSDKGALEPVTWPIDYEAESPELQLLGALEECGATFANWPMAVAIVTAWMERNRPNDSSVRQDGQKINRRIIVAQILKHLTDSATFAQAGQRAFCAAFDLKLTPHETASELAAALDVTPARVCQLRKAFNELFPENR